MARSTQGSSSVQVLRLLKDPVVQGTREGVGEEGALRWVRMASFSRRWNLSTRPFDWGWKEDIVKPTTPSAEQIPVHVVEVNWEPLSDVRAAGTPNLLIQELKRASTQSLVEADGRGTTFIHLVILSIIVKM